MRPFGLRSHRLSEVSLSGGLHLGKDHRRDFLGEVRLLLALDLNNNLRLAIDLNHLERPVLHVTCAKHNNALEGECSVLLARDSKIAWTTSLKTT